MDWLAGAVHAMRIRIRKGKDDEMETHSEDTILGKTEQCDVDCQAGDVFQGELFDRFPRKWLCPQKRQESFWSWTWKKKYILRGLWELRIPSALLKLLLLFQVKSSGMKDRYSKLFHKELGEEECQKTRIRMV
uniref:Uncharacterized protein n=1 Tax=Sphaerodactylus townsendi TaxID=933632 RepID=A0ACB8F7M6_9SAUR